MSASHIGGNVADIQSTAAVMVDTGAAATAAHGDAARFSTQMESEVEAVTTSLLTHFSQMADALTQQITAARNRLAATDWQGASRGEAEAAEAELNGQVQAVLARAQEGTTEFKTRMLSQSGAFVSAVQTEFGQVMRDIDATYQSFGDAQGKWAQGLADLDSSLRRG